MTEMSPAEAIFFAALKRPPGDRAADPQAEGLGFQRRRAQEESMTDFEDDFGTMPDPTASSAASIASALSFADFVAYAPSRTCIYLPCKALNTSMTVRYAAMVPALVLPRRGAAPAGHCAWCQTPEAKGAAFVPFGVGDAVLGCTLTAGPHGIGVVGPMR